MAATAPLKVLPREPVTFVTHQVVGDVTSALFTEDQSEEQFLLNRSQTEERLKNLLGRGVGAEETQKALDTWPK